MRKMLRLGTALALGASVLIAGTSTANAMGSGNPYEDLQVGVTYTVYQPGYTGGLKLATTGGAPCADDAEQNVNTEYGQARKRSLDITEGNPVCSDPGGTGKLVGTLMIRGATARVLAFCDPAEAQAWKACGRKDVSRVGGTLEVVLPGYGKLRPTRVILVTTGVTPLSYAQLVRVARSLSPIAANQQLIGGMATCTQADFGDVVAAGMPKGEVLVSVDEFRCDNGWAYAFATTGDGKGHNIGQTYIFEAEGQFWIPKDPDAVCGTGSSDTRPADALVPAAIWTPACRTN